MASEAFTALPRHALLLLPFLLSLFPHCGLEPLDLLLLLLLAWLLDLLGLLVFLCEGLTMTKSLTLQMSPSGLMPRR